MNDWTFIFKDGYRETRVFEDLMDGAENEEWFRRMIAIHGICVDYIVH